MKRKVYDDSVRAEVLRLLAEGFTYKEVAELTGVSTSTVDLWKNGPVRNAKREITCTGDYPARQSFKFLELINVKGELIISQKIKL